MLQTIQSLTKMNEKRKQRASLLIISERVYIYGRGDPAGSKLPFTMRFPPPHREILRKNALYSHLIGKLCRFHAAENQGIRQREQTGRIIRTAGCRRGVFMQVKLSSKGGWGGQETKGWRGSESSSIDVSSTLCRLLKSKKAPQSRRTNTPSPPFHFCRFSLLKMRLLLDQTCEFLQMCFWFRVSCGFCIPDPTELQALNSFVFPPQHWP